nr:FAD-binding protein [Paracoccaceae bacterium]
MPVTASLPRNEAGIAAVSGILKQRLGERFQTGRAMREQHGHTTTWIVNQPPDGVAFVETAEEVSALVALCAEHRVPVVPFGTGTSLEGHVNAPAGGISVDTSRMDKVLAVHPQDLDVVVQPGVTRTRLNAHLRDQGLFFPIDPGADASLGGMASTRASGTNAVRYGTMKDNVLALQAVLPDGRIIRTASRARKTSAGYDLTRLLIGAEGTLGIITELTLKLHGIPEAMSSATCSFPTVHAACEAVIATIQMGVPVARIELLDALQVRAV